MIDPKHLTTSALMAAMVNPVYDTNEAAYRDACIEELNRRVPVEQPRDSLLAAIGRLLTEGPPARRYWVQFDGSGHFQAVVEAHNGTDAILAARVRCRIFEGRRSLDTHVSCIRPALATDCFAGCGGEVDADGFCKTCGRTRERQILVMRGARNL